MKMPEETKQAQSATAEIGKISDTITGTGNLTLADAQSQTVPSRDRDRRGIEEIFRTWMRRSVPARMRMMKKPWKLL